MSSLRYRWLKFRGYKIYQFIKVAHSWDGEYPPAFGYYTKLKLRKGLSFKSVELKDLDPDYGYEMYKRGEL